MKQMNIAKFGWINGQWNVTSELSIPLDDRGLNLSDGIFETILIYGGKAKLFTNHLNRWQKSASILKKKLLHSERLENM